MTVMEKVRICLDLSCLTVNTHSLLSGYAALSVSAGIDG